MVAKRGLGSAFGDLLWFLEYLIRKDVGVERVMGMVDNFLYEDEGGLSTARLNRFYTRLQGARIMKFDGDDWLYLDLRDYRPVREHFRMRRRDG